MRGFILSIFFAFAIAGIAVLAARTPQREQAAPPSSHETHGSAPPQALILQEADGEHRVRRPGTPNPAWPFTIKVDGQNGNAQDFYVVTETMSPGQTIRFHKHDNAEEILILEEGGATVTVGDKRAVAGPRSIVFIPRDTWISTTNSGTQPIHLYAIFSRQGYERYMRAISAREGQPITPLNPEELPRLRADGHSTYWDTSKGAYPPGVPHP
jgi:mannose-6-phosphate isomerase-like protein (cupin superfamily)